MNRHERRAKAARDRQTGRAVPTVRLEGEAKEAFRRDMMSDESQAVFDRVVHLMVEWSRDNPGVRLEWHPRAEHDNNIYVGPLGAPEARALLAANEAADALLVWIDQQTGGKASTLHASIAVEFIEERMREYRAQHVRKENPVMKLLRSYAERAGTTTRVPDSPCPHCGAITSAASDGTDGGAPYPGAPTVCVKCGGIACFAEDLTLRRYTDEEWAALDAGMRSHLDEVSTLFRAAALHKPGTRPSGGEA